MVNASRFRTSRRAAPDTCAAGLRAVGYLADKQSDQYDMFDVLNLK